MKIAFIHYNIGEEGGVNSVMRINAITLKKLIKNVQISFIGSYMGKIIDGKGFHYTDLPELGITQKRISDFSSMNVSQYIKMGDKIYDKLVKCTKDIDHVIIENPIIGIHPPATYAFYKFISNTKKRVRYRVHDFPQDRKTNFIDLLKFNGQGKTPSWREIVYPSKNVEYFVLTKHDLNLLLENGIKENQVFHIPNPINKNLLQKDTKGSMLLRSSIIKKHKLNPKVKFLLYPVRVIPRKNVEEAIFIVQFLNLWLNEKYHLLVTLFEKSMEKEDYANTLVRFVEKNNLPVTLGLDLLANRIVKSNKIEEFAIGDAYNICESAITTSRLEGFGLFFIESWLFNKPIFGRILSNSTNDFKEEGLDLSVFYDKLIVNGKDYKNIKDLKEKLSLILKLKEERFLNKVYEANKNIFDKIENLLKGKDKKFILRNKKKVLLHYSAESIAKKILKAMN